MTESVQPTSTQRAMFVLATVKAFDEASLGERVETAFPDLPDVDRKMIYDEAGMLVQILGLYDRSGPKAEATR